MKPSAPSLRSRLAEGGMKQQPASKPASGLRLRERGNPGACKSSPARKPKELAPGSSRTSCSAAEWSVSGARESASTFGSKITAKLHEYEVLGRRLREAREDLQCHRSRLNQRKQARPGLLEQIKALKTDIESLEAKRQEILEGAGPFREKLLNDQRFLDMKAGRSPEPEDVFCEEESSSSSMEDKSLAAAQVALPVSDTEADAEVTDGGGLLSEIVRMESPVHFQDFSFGEDLGEDLPSRKRKKCKKTEMSSFVFKSFQRPGSVEKQNQAAGSLTLPVPLSDVEGGQEQGDIKTAIMADATPKEGGDGVLGVRRRISLQGQSSCPSVVVTPGGGTSRVGQSPPCDTMEAPPIEIKLLSPASSAVGVVGGAGVSGLPPPPAGIPKVAAASLPVVAGRKYVIPGGVAEKQSPGEISKVKRGSGPVSCIPGGSETSVRGPGAGPIDGTSDQVKSNGVTVLPCLGALPSPGKQGVNKVQTGENESGKGMHGGETNVSSKESMHVKGSSGVQEREHEHVHVREQGRMDDESSSKTSKVQGRAEGKVDDGSSSGKNEVQEGVNVRVNGESSSMNTRQGRVNEEAVSKKNAVSTVGVSQGSDLAAPPAATRSYASVAAGGPGESSHSPSKNRAGYLQQRLLEALRRGETTFTVEGREVDTSFWVERHGLGAFREQNGEIVWSLQTPGQEIGRRNVARLAWRGSDACPQRKRVVELLLQMGFRANDIYALIHPYGTTEFDISFVRPEGLERFWSNYELMKDEPGWRDFAVKAISRQNTIKKVTVLTRNESLSCYDIMTWLGRFGEVTDIPRKNLDEFGIWSGAWTFMVRLKRSGNSVTHIPSATFLGRDRIQVFYQGQPKTCYRCGDPNHVSAACTKIVCALCRGEGHLADACRSIRCHLCGDLGHPFSRCPRSYARTAAAQAGESRVVAPEGERTSEGGGAPQPMKIRHKTPSRLRREEKRRTSRDLEERPQAAGVTQVPAADAGLSQAEVVEDVQLDEEIRRMHKEEGDAMDSGSSQYESAEEDGGPRQDIKQQCSSKKRKKNKGRGKKAVSLSVKSSFSKDRKLKEQLSTQTPLVVLSNRFEALGNTISPSDGGGIEGQAEGESSPLRRQQLPSGDAAPVPPDVTSKKGQEAQLNDECEVMDLSASKKRGRRGSSSSGDTKV